MAEPAGPPTQVSECSRRSCASGCPGTGIDSHRESYPPGAPTLAAASRAQGSEQHLRGEAGPDSLAGPQAQLQQGLEAQFGEYSRVRSLAALLTGDKPALHGRLEADREQRRD